MRRNSGFFRTELMGLGVLLIGLGVGCGEMPEDATTETDSALRPASCVDIGMTNDTVCACDGYNGTGNCTLYNSTQRFYTSLVGNAFNDKIKSLYLGINVRLKACQDDTYRGICDYLPDRTGLSEIPNLDAALAAGTWKLNGHQITAIYVDRRSEQCLSPGPTQVALFKDDNYSPNECTLISRPFSTDGLYPNAGSNAWPDGTHGGFGWPHDTLSSIIVGASVKVELYQESNYGGGKLVANPGERIPRLSARGNFDDIISSIIVRLP